MTTDNTTSTDNNPLARKLSIAGDETRLKILKLMFEWGDGCVSSVADKLDISVATASYHLNLMADNGYFTRQRDGQTICYELKDDEFIQCLEKLVKRI